MASGNTLCAQAQCMVQKRFEFDLGIAEHIRIGCAASFIFTQKIAEYAILILGAEIDCFDIQSNDIGDSQHIQKILACGTRLIILVIPVFHEQAGDAIALLFEQQGGDSRIHAA